MNELDVARLETIVELGNELLAATRKILLVHGEDPEYDAILASSYTLAIRQINEMCPGFTRYMITMLEQEE